MAAEARPAARGLRRTRDVLVSAGPVVLAFLASQHHTLHMLVLTFGVGTAGMSFLTLYPAIRRGMLALSLVAAGVAAYQATRQARPLPMRLVNALSAVATLGLVAWSLAQFGA